MSNKRILPKEYVQVEYLQSTGTQYIDTGYAASSGYKADLDVFVDDWSNSGFIMGSHNSNEPYGRNYLRALSTGGIGIGAGGYATTSDLGLTTKFNVKFSTVVDDIWLKVNNTEIALSIQQAETTRSSNSLHLFEQNGWSTGAKFLGKIYKCKIYSSDDTLVRNMIPCKRVSDGRAGMYNICYDVSKYGYIDLGTLTWTKYSGANRTTFYATISDAKLVGAGNIPGVYIPGYTTVTSTNYTGFGRGTGDMETTLHGTVASIQIANNSYSGLTVAEFKAAMSGVMLSYQRTTDTSFENPFYVNAASGTDFTMGPEIITQDEVNLNKRKLLSTKLPSTYTELEYIGVDGASYIDTGLYYNPTTMTSVRVSYNLHTDLSYDNKFFGSLTGVGLGIYNSEIRAAIDGSWEQSSYAMTLGDHVDEITYDGTTMYFYHDDTLMSTMTLSTFIDTNTLLIGMVNGESSYANYIKYYSVTVGSAGKFIPAKRISDSVIGMYDTVTGTFFANKGTGAFTAGPEIFAPVTNKRYLPYYPSTDLTGLTTQAGTPTPTNPIYPTCVQPYNLQGIGSYLDKYYVNGGVDETRHTGGKTDMGTLTWTYHDGTYPYFQSSGISDMYNWTGATDDTNIYALGYTKTIVQKVEQSDMQIATKVRCIYISDHRYTDAATFTAAISGTYVYYQTTSQTSWTAPTGVAAKGKVRNIGIKVLDGTETWDGSTYFSTSISDMMPALYGPGYCSHFTIRSSSLDIADIQLGANSNTIYIFEITSKPSGVTDVTTWKAWLAAQYAAGTPVIIYYPLATPTTETASFARLIVNKRRVLFTKTITPGETLYPGDTLYPDD